VQVLLDHPWILLVGIGLLPLVPVVPFRWAWVALLLSFLWADSILPLARVVQVARWGLVPLVLAQGLLRLRGSGPGERLPLPAVVLFGWCALSLLWAEQRAFAVVTLGFLVATAGITFGLVPRLAPTVDLGLRTARTAVLVVLAVLALGLVPGLATDESSVSGRFRGPFMNANGMGLATALVAPWALVFAWSRVGGARLLGYATVAGLVVLGFLSGSRTGFGGLVVALATTAFLRQPSRFVLVVGFLGFALSLLAVSGGGDLEVEQRTSHLVRQESIAKLSGRAERWEEGIRRFSQRPLLGHGYLASRDVELGVGRDASGGAAIENRARGTNYHSQHVETLVDLGLPGEGLLLALLVAVGRRLRRLSRDAPDPRARAAGGAMFGTFLAVAVDSFFHNWLLTPGSPYALLFWSLTAVAFRLEALSAAPRAAPSPAPRALAAVPA
jgi:O-antigen ligase